MDRAEKVRALYDAWARRDIEGMRAGFAPDFVWHVPGNNPLSGDYRGEAFFTDLAPRVAQADRWEFDIHAIVVGTAPDDHAVALFRLRGARGDKTLDQNGCHVIHLDGEDRIAEAWGMTWDQAAVDDFWS